MREHWNFTNTNNKAISYEQFLELANQFTSCVTAQYGESKTLITVLDATPEYTTFMPENAFDDMMFRDMQQRNEDRTILKTDTIGAISEEVWKSSRFVKMHLDPLDKRGDQSYAFATAEFRGHMPQAVSFSVQGGEDKPETVYHAMAAIMPQGMDEGDYYASNAQTILHMPGNSISDAPIVQAISLSNGSRQKSADLIYREEAGFTEPPVLDKAANFVKRILGL